MVAIALLATACGDTGNTAAPGPTSDATSVPPNPASSASPSSSVGVADLAIGLCSDVQTPVPSVIGTLTGGQNTPWELNGLLATYVAEHPDTYAGRWIDRKYGGTVVLAFTDDPGPHLEEILGRRPSESDIAAIEPRPPITVDWTVAESGYAVDVVQVAYTQVELRALQTKADQLLPGRDDIVVVGSGSGNLFNRVSLDLIRPTVAHLNIIASEFPDSADMFCLNGELWDDSTAPPSVDEPLTMMANAGEDPLVTCRGAGPFPLSALGGEPDVDPTSNDPLINALLTSTMSGSPVPQQGWRTLTRDDETALFGHFEDASLVLIHPFENTIAGWSLRGRSAGKCELHLAVADGVDLMNIGLDPARPVDPESTMLHLMVSQTGCASGASGVENMRPPEIIESATEIRIAIAVIPPEGPQECPGNQTAPITIDLQSPIGDREILDGARIPPRLLEARTDP